MVEELAPCSQVIASSIHLLCPLPRDMERHGKTERHRKMERERATVTSQKIPTWKQLWIEATTT